MSLQSFQETLVSAQGDGSALTAAAAASLLPSHALFTLPSNFFNSVGKALRIRATGRISCAVTTPGTARFSVRLGATTVFDGLAQPLNIVAKTNVGWDLDLLLTCRAIGSSANLIGQGKWTSEAVVGSPLPSAGGSGVHVLPYNAAPAVGSNFDSTASQLLDLYFTQTVATGSITLHQYILEALN